MDCDRTEAGAGAGAGEVSNPFGAVSRSIVPVTSPYPAEVPHQVTSSRSRCLPRISPFTLSRKQQAAGTNRLKTYKHSRMSVPFGPEHFFFLPTSKNANINTDRAVVLPAAAAVLLYCWFIRVWNLVCHLNKWRTQTESVWEQDASEDVWGLVSWSDRKLEKTAQWGASWFVLLNIIRVVKSRGTRWVVHVARMGRREMHTEFWLGSLKDSDHVECPVYPRRTIAPNLLSSIHLSQLTVRIFLMPFCISSFRLALGLPLGPFWCKV